MYLKATDIPLTVGDRVYIHTGGGGGYGAPLERDPESVASDVRRGYVSAGQARQLYGVVLGADLQVQAQQTQIERQGRQA